MKRMIGFLLLMLTALGANAAEDKERAEQLQFWMYNPKNDHDNQKLHSDHSSLAVILERRNPQSLAEKEIDRIIDLIRAQESPVSSGLVIDLITLSTKKKLSESLLGQLKQLLADVSRAEAAQGIKGPVDSNHSDEDEQQ